GPGPPNGPASRTGITRASAITPGATTIGACMPAIAIRPNSAPPTSGRRRDGMRIQCDRTTPYSRVRDSKRMTFCASPVSTAKKPDDTSGPRIPEGGGSLAHLRDGCADKMLDRARNRLKRLHGSVQVTLQCRQHPRTLKRVEQG